MNYEAQREERNRKRKKRRKIEACVGAIVLCGLTAFSFFVPPATWKYYVKKPKIAKLAAGDCRVHFLSVGQGDCSVIELPDGKTMVIDGGDGANGHTAYILRYLNALGVKKPDYLVATHTDGDHTGGLAEMVSVKGAGEIFMPYVTYDGGTAFDEFLLAAKKEEIRTTFSRRGISLSSHDSGLPYDLCFISPLSKDTPGNEYAKANGNSVDDGAVNDTSAVIYLDYCGSTVLFCGDITAEKEQAILREEEAGLIACDGKEITLCGVEILKAAHHGSASSSCEEFIRALSVRDAVVSAGINNTYSHPSTEVLGRFERNGVNVHRTDYDGTVTITLKPDGTYTVDNIPAA